MRNTGARTFFSTGGPIPSTRITGTVWDWGASRTARNALVEAVTLPDSVTYVTIADSLGRFTLDHIPRGRLLLRGLVDENANRGLDPREAWDSITVTLSESLQTDILAFPHDTIAPVIASVSEEDSLRIRVNFDRSLAPDGPIGPAQFSLRSADSTVVGIVSLRVPPPDSAASAAAPPRPPPPRSIILTIATPLRPSATYRLSVTGVRGLLGASVPSTRVFTTRPVAVPAPAPKPAGTSADSVKR